MRRRTLNALAALALGLAPAARAADLAADALLPTGQRITPAAAPGATIVRLSTDLRPDGNADANGAVTAALSPDGTTLLVLTSGYNTYFYTPGPTPIVHRVLDPRSGTPSGVTTPNAEWIFVFDVRGPTPRMMQRIDLPNTYHGLVWAPNGRLFYVSGGVEDRVAAWAATERVASTADARWAPNAPFVPLGHNSAPNAPLSGRDGGPLAGTPIGRDPAKLAAVLGPTSALLAGLALSADGRTLAAVNLQNDSLSFVDTQSRRVTGEVRFFRPGDRAAIGELPYWAAVLSGPNGAPAKTYVTSQRDGQVMVVRPDGTFSVIGVGGEPNRLLLDRRQQRLFVANGDLDEIEVIDTARDEVVQRLSLRRPGDPYLGAGPDGLTLSPDERRLYVTLGGENALAVVDLAAGRVLGRIPTGWFPSDVAVSRDGTRLYVVNSKAPAGPSDYVIDGTDSWVVPQSGHDGYVLGLEKASLLSLPVPDETALARLSAMVDANNGFGTRRPDPMMAFLRPRIRHVIYVQKENRSYDQVLGDLKQGDGDPKLVQFPRPITPNHHALAERFALLDRFSDSGDVSGDGWNWTFQGHANVYTQRTVPVDYGNAGFALPFDWNGSPRNIGVALPDRAPGTPRQDTVRITTLLDPSGRSSIEPGPKDVTATEGADDDRPGARGGYIWDSVLRAGKSFRHYGLYSDENYYIPGSPVYLPIVRDAGARRALQSVPLRPALIGHDDPYFRGWDLNAPDQYRFEEWKREFDQFLARGDVPAFEVIDFMMDHFGSFGTNVAHLDTPFTQMASNDYAIGQLAEAVSHSPIWSSTAIFVVEDDAQDGPDHVDAHRSVVQVISPWTRAGSVVHTDYSTVNVLRTIEDLLGVDHLGTNDARARPMADVFATVPDLRPYEAIVPGVLCNHPVAFDLVPACHAPAGPVITEALPSAHDGAWWIAATRGMDFARPDRVRAARFNDVLRRGLQANP